MRTVKSKLLIFCLVVGCLIAARPAYATPYFLLDSQEEWQAAMGTHIRPALPSDWSEYMNTWMTHLKEGAPYPTNTFQPAQLWVYGGGGGGGLDPNDAGLVMFWGDASLPTGYYSSAWMYDYGLVFCLYSIDGYSFFSFIRASSVVNRQFTFTSLQLRCRCQSNVSSVSCGALTNMINAALGSIDRDNYAVALEQLQNTILRKTDGCAETGAPDKDDWILTCSAQEQVYALILEAIQYLEEAMQ